MDQAAAAHERKSNIDQPGSNQRQCDKKCIDDKIISPAFFDGIRICSHCFSPVFLLSQLQY